MKRKNRIKLNFVRNWNLPGKERLANWLKSATDIRQDYRDGIVWLNTEDIAIYTTADNYIEWSILSTGTYEDEINKLIRISLKEGDNALDIGGNIGLQSIRMAQCVGAHGRVYAFEPLGYLRSKFQKNIELNRLKQVTLLPFALADKPAETTFMINETEWNQGTFSLGQKDSGSKAEPVTVKVADDLPEVQALAKLALIKIDVEGFELNVLRGLLKTISRHRPRIIFEYDEHYWHRAGQTIAEAHQLLTSLGYVFYQVTPAGCVLAETSLQIKSGNLFCINK